LFGCASISREGGSIIVSTGKGKESRDATAQLLKIVHDHRQGQAVGIYSICSANRYVLEAGMLQASRDHSLLSIESTPNQVNQFGGYTGQTPADFATFVRSVASAMKFPAERILLGGDHLGPHVWRHEPSHEAMAKARELVRSCVQAGYTKIHLDASMRCADDAGDPHSPLADEIVCDRAADLCSAAEEAHQQLDPGAPAPVYVVGTEVPIPGGEQSESQAPATTRTEDLQRTLRLANQAFLTRGLQAAWQRVVAVVVQPGVEFGDASVFAYDATAARHLSQHALEHWQGVYEAHSTDYQTPQALRQMVQDHFAILKVGPWLTFAFREAVFALAAIEEEYLSSKERLTISRVREVLDQAMIENPAHWRGYFHGDERSLRLARKYSYSDRSRYYWPQPRVTAALQQLIDNLTAHRPPTSIISQYLPNQCAAIRAGILSNHPPDLIRSKILEVLDHYAAACGMRST
jgi:D-tagatose-1,6-bisphosphate aldolase subunit GatZ/KbaZ